MNSTHTAPSGARATRLTSPNCMFLTHARTAGSASPRAGRPRRTSTYRRWALGTDAGMAIAGEDATVGRGGGRSETGEWGCDLDGRRRVGMSPASERFSRRAAGAGASGRKDCGAGEFGERALYAQGSGDAKGSSPRRSSRTLGARGGRCTADTELGTMLARAEARAARAPERARARGATSGEVRVAS